MKDADLPHLGDTNGNPIPVKDAVQQRVTLGNALYRMGLVVVEKLAFTLLVGAQFMNRNVEVVSCNHQSVKLTRGQILILANGTRDSPWAETPAVAGQPQSPPIISTSFVTAQRIRFCLDRVLPAFTEVKAAFFTKCPGLIVLGPKLAWLEKCKVHAMSSVHQVRADAVLSVLLSNFCALQRGFRKNTVVTMEAS